MQKLLLSLTLFIASLTTYGQTYAKFNTVTAIVGVPNIGVETSIGKKFTFQFDVTASFWKSVNGGPQQFVIAIPELRYHFNENFKGFYVGAHVGGGTFKAQKWNYFNTDMYQKGYNLYYGASIGYQWQINDKIMLDLFAGGGNQQGFYKGYHLSTGERYESVRNYNKSGEWFPYRGGVMLSYKF
ncbi:DUF3575 domain-containing protein [Flavobacterium kingsejongi]|uniref:DUF3575 domain-containing protein n=1 Tax=Flavobacterium kingsejongi TaxID=1678728 RepID=A0A2S1LSB7_9FLAO|nr:DUF3575 domain-containing protein [Flavobacterium kingsejongi]AWG26653.1 hypothetical protein FK004_16180 [Flavobacterium kingsejongi]